MEIRDLYDENKILTGETIIKGQAVPAGRYYLTVVVFISNFEDQLLIQLTSPQKHHLWSTTGGHPVSGETSLEGIVTEIKEELGIDVDKSKLILFKTIKTVDDFVDIYYLNMDIDINKITVQEAEVEAVKWASISQIKEMIDQGLFLPAHVDFFNEYLEYKLKISKCFK